jgi:hypothetical protein
MKREAISAIVFWLSLFLVVFLFQWISESDYRRLEKEGIRTTGRIVELLPHHRRGGGSVRYEFEAGGRVRSNLGEVGAIGMKTLEMEIGEIVPVVYLPNNLAISCIGNPGTGLSTLRKKILIAFLFATVALLLSLLVSAFKKSVGRPYISDDH